MKLRARANTRTGYSLVEALVYISLVTVVLGCASMAMYRGLDHLFAVKRNADDISAALKVGELWRADVRSASGGVTLAAIDDDPILRIHTRAGEVIYRMSGEVLWRTRNGASSALLRNVRNSAMLADTRGSVLAWRWELELQPRTKGVVKPGRVRPLFTFVAVAPQRQP
jgi:hypothetical protein